MSQPNGNVTLKPMNSHLLLQSITAAAKGLENSEQESVAPLSFAEHRLWFLNQLRPDSCAYHLPCALRLRGNLNIEALRAALTEIIRRHETLRTTYPSVGHEPRRNVSGSTPCQLPEVDLTSLPESEKRQTVRSISSKESRRPFNLAQGPLIRFLLVHSSRDEHLLLVTMHHIISDAWSLGILSHELGVLYSAFCRNQPSPLPQLPIQYSDFARWQHRFLQGTEFAGQLAFWKKELAGDLPRLELPKDHISNGQNHERASYHDLPISPELRKALMQLSRSHNGTIFITILAAFQLLLHRLSGQEEILLGSPVAGRAQPETESLIGFFLNLLVLRTSFTPNMTFHAHLEQVRQRALDGYSNQEVPFERLVEELRPDRHHNENPFFDVLINSIDPPAIPEMPDLTTEWIDVDDYESKFSITMYLHNKRDSVSLRCVYQPSLFSSARISGMLEQLKLLLEQIAARPEALIDSYSIATTEARRILPDASIPLKEPTYPPVTALLIEQAMKNPEAPAIAQGGRTWSYREVLQSASAVAKLLQDKGLARSEIVAITGPRSFELVSSTVAILLAGGAILPIDPALPLPRQEKMLMEANCKKLIQVGAGNPEQRSLEKIPSLEIIGIPPAFFLEAAPRAVETPILTELSPNDPAYLFFTSGTTGRPKGVLGCHKGLAHFIHWQRKAFSIGRGDRCAQLTGLSFDVVLRDLFLPLCSGATLVLRNEAEADQSDFLHWMARRQITILHTVPTLAQTWLGAAVSHARIESMRWIFFAGEPLTDALITRCRDVFPSAEFVNLYGPTETTLAKCFYKIPAVMESGIQPVGSPLPQTQALVLNKQEGLCGLGEVGEIAIRTPFRSLGYLHSSEHADSARFIPNKFTRDPGDLIYKTGDRGRYQLDGTLEILGRLDQQVKIRGVRIEPEEISTAILSLDAGIRSCVVLVRKNSAGEPFLVAYLVAPGVDPKVVAKLRLRLSELLPAAMVPGAFMFIEKLPSTANGKIDRNALPTPDLADMDNDRRGIAPRTQLEMRLQKIWAEVLDKPELGIHDDFFSMGGHSMLAVGVTARMKKEFGPAVRLNHLFQWPTIEQMAHFLKGQVPAQGHVSLVIMGFNHVRPAFHCIAGRGATVLTLQYMARALNPDFNVMGFHSHDLPGIPMTATRVEEIAAANLKELEPYPPKGPWLLGGFCFGSLFAYEMAQQLAARGQPIGLLVMIEPSISMFPHDGIGRNIDRYAYHLGKLLHGSTAEKLRYLKERVHNTRRRMLSKAESDHKARLEIYHKTVKDYSIKPFDGRMLIILGKDSYYRFRPGQDPRLEWGKFATKGFDVFEFPGDHETLLREPFVRPLAEQLKMSLLKVANPK